ncbi:MAG TPA: hypothetical protein VEV17_01575 [Bryobacteraceae bacterium]|nr:hypothetical protein [Bryobacteraceae bacterium]
MQHTAQRKRNGRIAPVVRTLCWLLLAAGCLLAANIRLYLKDGTYQIVREYKVEGDRVRLFSADRGEWEEMPLELVDVAKTEAEIKQRAEETRENAAAADAEEKAERQARREVEQIPVENGVYLIENEKLVPIKAAESKIVTNKGRSVLKVLSPLPLVTGKATVELDGPHATTGTANREPEFYIRLSEDERFGILRMGDHKGNRVVEKLTIIPVSKENVEEPDMVETFRRQVGDGLFKIWPEKPLAPGEYAVVEYTEGKVNMQVWDFFIAPGTGK